MAHDPSVAPRWAERVPKWKIARLYENDARGICDEELIDDVAYALLSRCESMIVAAEAHEGRAACPSCAAVLAHDGERRSELRCRACSWTGVWEAYWRSYKGTHLIAPGLVPFCREYIETLPTARTPRQKMLRIDWLIHRFHWEGTELRGQPGATSLIEGRARDVNAFLAALSSGRLDVEGLSEPHRYWSEERLRQVAVWRQRAERREAIR